MEKNRWMGRWIEKIYGKIYGWLEGWIKKNIWMVERIKNNKK